MFQAAKTLQESGELSTGDWKRLEEILDWFNEHLERPERMSISRRPRSKLQAISWFKSTAKQHIQRMREFQRMLEEHGIVVEMIRARRLGYVLYEDDYQVTAYPFNDTPS